MSKTLSNLLQRLSLSLSLSLRLTSLTAIEDGNFEQSSLSQTPNEARRLGFISPVGSDCILEKFQITDLLSVACLRLRLVIITSPFVLYPRGITLIFFSVSLMQILLGGISDSKEGKRVAAVIFRFHVLR